MWSSKVCPSVFDVNVNPRSFEVMRGPNRGGHKSCRRELHAYAGICERVARREA